MYNNIGLNKLQTGAFQRSFMLPIYYLGRVCVVLLIASLVFVNNAKADNTMETIFNQLTSISCETEGAVNLLRSEFSHTCVPESLLTFVIANAMSPGLYANTLLRLNMNDPDLFPDTCLRENRADFNDPRISFSLCNNMKLVGVRLEALADTAAAIAYSFLMGTDPWGEIKDAWELDKSKYHNIYNNKAEGDQDAMWDIGIIPYFPWKVIRAQDRLCVATQGFSGWIPMGCKFIKEPYPVSIYSDFLDLSSDGVDDLERLTTLTTCGTMGSCYKRAYENSRTPIVMTGPLIECVKEMAAKLMISNAVCSFDDVDAVLGSNSRYTSALFIFQKRMHTTVSALLTIYIILFGFKMLLSGDVPPKSEIVKFVIKFLFVVYFSVGINITPGGSELDRMDGMIQWAFPFLLKGMDQLASWMINASPSGLCVFDDVYYPDSLQHLRLWDALDCKISHYIGLDAVQTMIVENASRHHDTSRFDIVSFPIPPYVFLLIPGLITGNFMLVSLALMYPLLVISVAAFIVNATVVCIVSIVILGVLAPLFVPLYLFEYTKGYFESWVKLLISFLLQPMVAVVFMTTMMAIYDYGYYGTCKYDYTDFSYGGASFTVTVNAGAAGSASASAGDRVVRYYYIDQDWTHYTSEEEKGCQESLGFILNNPFQFAFGSGASLAGTAMPWLTDSTGDEEKNRFDFLSAIQGAGGMFFSSFEVIFDTIKKLVIALFTASFTLYLMYHFSESLAEFAADMTEGVSLSNMSIKPQSLFKSAMAALPSSSRGTDGADRISAGRKEGASDRMAAPRGGDDKISAPRGGGEDKISAPRGGDDKISAPRGGGDASTGSNAGGSVSSASDGSKQSVGDGGNKDNSATESRKGDVNRTAENKNDPGKESK